MTRVPYVQTPLPGPKAKLLIDADARVASTSLIKEYPLAVERARGMIVEDLDGNRFLDFMAGIAVAITGHCHPEVVTAIGQQSQKLLHICGTDFYYEGYTRLCQKLSALGPESHNWLVFLGNSGAEAVEAAVKLARYYTRRPYIIAFQGAFHGRTFGAVSLTASKAKQRAGFGPLLPGVVHVPYGYCYRCPYHLTYPHCDVYCIESWRESLFMTSVPPEEVAAVVVEPIQGEGGHIVPPPEYFPRLRKLCDDHGILLVADEIQSGMGRTGSFFALQHWGVTPDIITLGKGLGSGMPISAMMAKKQLMTWPSGSHGSTFGGNPVCCAAGVATVDLVVGGLMGNAVQMGRHLQEKLIGLQSGYECIGDVRGMGLMLALEFVSDREKKAKAPRLADTFVQRCFQKGLLVLGCGESAVRFAPPLIVTRGEIDTALEIVSSVLEEMK